MTELNNEVERVKADQQRLDRELDFILSQQEELEELLQPIGIVMMTHQNPLPPLPPSFLCVVHYGSIFGLMDCT